MTRRPLGLLACSCLLGAGLLAGCGSSEEPSSGSTVASPSPSVSESPTQQAGDEISTGSAEPVEVNKSVTDPQLGEKATVISYVRGFELPESVKQKYAAYQDAEIILVQLKITASKKFYDNFGETSFALTGASNGIDVSPTTSVIAPQMTAAGYEPLQDVRTGKTGTGWIAFAPRTELDGLTLRLKRSATSTSDGQQFPEKNFDISLA